MKKTLLFFGLGLLAVNSSSAQSWQQQNANSQNDFSTIFAASDSKVHAFGDSTDIFGGFALGSHYITGNQGFSWNYSPLNSIVYKSAENFFVSTNIGYLVGKNQLSGNGFILKTINGGDTWTEDTPHVERLEGVDFETANLGYAVGRNDYVTKTTDGGLNWTDVSSNTGDHLAGVDFTTPLNGYVVGRAGVIAYTIDGAATWVNQNSNTPEDLEAVSFVNDSTGWAVGTAGAIVFTNDYGTTWTNQNSGTNEDLLDVEFVNNTTGWAVGTAGTVLMTTDAGTTWTPENSGTPEDIFSITMRSDQLGWFCGDNGTIFIYTLSLPNSIKETNNSIDVSVAPNPFNKSTTLKIEGSDDEIYNVNLVDISGKVIRTYKTTGNSNTTIERNELESGIYLLQISNKETVTTQKLVVK